MLLEALCLPLVVFEAVPLTSNTGKLIMLGILCCYLLNVQVTPWLIVNTHAPLVSSWQGSFKDAECMRLVYEPLLFKHNVDLVFNGHTHA